MRLCWHYVEVLLNSDSKVRALVFCSEREQLLLSQDRMAEERGEPYSKWLFMPVTQPIIVHLPNECANIVCIFFISFYELFVCDSTPILFHEWQKYLDGIQSGLSPRWRGLCCQTCAANRTVLTVWHHQQNLHHCHHYVCLTDSCCTVTVMQQGHDALLGYKSHTQPASEQFKHTLYNKPSLSRSLCTVELDMNY